MRTRTSVTVGIEKAKSPNHSKVSEPQQTFNSRVAFYRRARKSTACPAALWEMRLNWHWLCDWLVYDGQNSHYCTTLIKCCCFNKQAQRGSPAAVVAGKFLRNQLLSVLMEPMYNSSARAEVRSWLAMSGRKDPSPNLQSHTVAGEHHLYVYFIWDEIYKWQLKLWHNSAARPVD